MVNPVDKNHVVYSPYSADLSVDNLLTEITAQHQAYYPDFSKIESLLDECLSKKQDERVKKAIDQFESQEKKLKDSDCYKSLLFNVISKGKESLALKLIKLKICSINDPCTYSKETPLHIAVENGLPDVTQALLEYGAEINPVTYDLDHLNQATPLTKCVKYGLNYDYGNDMEIKKKVDEIFQILMAHGADPKIGWDLCKPTFHWIIQSHNEEWIQQTVEKIDPNCKQRHTQKSALFVAATVGNLKLIEKLVQLGAEVDAFAYESLYCERRMTPLHVSVLYNNPTVAQGLLSVGANVNQRAINPFYTESSNKGLGRGEPLTPFQEAVDLDRKEIVKLMCNSGQKLEKKLFIKRSFLDGEKAEQKGYLSLETRIETEIVKNKQQLELVNSPFRVYTSNEDHEKQLQSIFDKSLVSKESISTALFLCKPILETLELMSKKNPELSICFVKSNDYKGCYNADTGEEIILSADLETSTQIIPVLIHEATHKIVDALYKGRHCAPSEDSEFYSALEKDLQMQGDYSLVRILWSQIEGNYEKGHWPAEYLARIPQAAAILAMKDVKEAEIEEILSKSIPHTYAFFKKDLLPRCETYLKENLS